MEGGQDNGRKPRGLGGLPSGKWKERQRLEEMWGESIEVWDPQFCASIEMERDWVEELQAEVVNSHLLHRGKGHREGTLDPEAYHTSDMALLPTLSNRSTTAGDCL